MEIFEDKLKKIILDHHIEARHLSFDHSCHTVGEAAQAANASVDEMVKNICFIGDKGELIVAIVKGEDSVDAVKIGNILQIEKPRKATLEEILSQTGYPVGGIPSFGYDALFLIDSCVLEKDQIYSGGGSENSLVKISSKELQKANQGRVVEIRS